jgi:ribose-phosphate diphosphokinase
MLYLNDNEVKFIILPNQEKRLDLPLEFINNLHENIVLWTYETDASIFELLLFDEVMAKLEHRYKLVIGYMPYSRMDRVHEANTAFSLKVIVQLLSEQTSALEEVFVLDPHSPETLNKFKEFGMKVQEIDYSLADEVMEFANVNLDETWIVFPDRGAANRYDYYKYPNVIICEKTRNFATGAIESVKVETSSNTFITKEMKPNLIVIDDLCSYGGTFIKVLEAIEKHPDINFDEAWLIVTHAEKAMEEGKILEKYNKVFCTDSISVPAESKDMTVENFTEDATVYFKKVKDIEKNSK